MATHPITKKSSRVLVAMSGGVDSSVAAALLVEQGYVVTGAFMKQWSDTQDISGVCSWKQDRRDALRVAAALDIPLLTLDFEKEYKAWVMEYMFAEYTAGRTPNPDVMCNKFIKFGSWLQKARELGFEYLATGHYASVTSDKHHPVRYHLMQSRDDNKDQTYFLHQLSQEQLAHTLFPIGEYTKEQVRAMAQRYSLPTAQREESMGICFVGEVPMKEFLEQRIPHSVGKIVMSTGEVVGTHDGLSFYTIGQRHGFNQQGGDKPLFVVAKRQEKNELVVGYEDDSLLYSSEIRVLDMHWISGQEPDLPLECLVRTRHRQALQAARVHVHNGQTAVTFTTPQRAITPGQFVVMYTKDECLGGGVIA